MFMFIYSEMQRVNNTHIRVWSEYEYLTMLTQQLVIFGAYFRVSITEYTRAFKSQDIL